MGQATKDKMNKWILSLTFSNAGNSHAAIWLFITRKNYKQSAAFYYYNDQTDTAVYNTSRNKQGYFFGGKNKQLIYEKPILSQIMNMKHWLAILLFLFFSQIPWQILDCHVVHLVQTCMRFQGRIVTITFWGSFNSPCTAIIRSKLSPDSQMLYCVKW